MFDDIFDALAHWSHPDHSHADAGQLDTPAMWPASDHASLLPTHDAHQQEHGHLQPESHMIFHTHPTHVTTDYMASYESGLLHPPPFDGIGHPSDYSHYWQHQTREDCAVMAQGEVLESVTGIHLTEQQLCDLAQAHGWYNPQSGTMPENVGNILELYGIHVTHQFGGNFEDLVNALKHEQRVIVGLNANEIWHPRYDNHGEPIKQSAAGHAVWVSGIEATPTGVKVTLVDSGIPNGRMEIVRVEDFLNAWEDGGNFMMTTPPLPVQA